MFYDYKRVPRRFKKKWKHILQSEKFNFLDLNQKLWYILGLKDPKQRDKIIKQILSIYAKT